LLAAYLSICHFSHFHECHQFQLWTDHKPLVTAMSPVTPPISPRQQRHLAFISEFSVKMLYLPGLQNVIADFLSWSSFSPWRHHRRHGLKLKKKKFGFEAIAAEQNLCPETQRLLRGTSPTIA
jgi:hypothetical protein